MPLGQASSEFKLISMPTMRNPLIEKMHHYCADRCLYLYLQYCDVNGQSIPSYRQQELHEAVAEIESMLLSTRRFYIRTLESSSSGYNVY